MSSKMLLRGTPLTLTLWNPKIQHKLLQLRRLSSKTNCSSLQPPNVSHLAKTAHISLTPTEVEEFGPKIQQVIGCCRVLICKALSPPLEQTLKTICATILLKYLIIGMRSSLLFQAMRSLTLKFQRS
ncbi:unnamed protein product [Trifolium pratense]|uniref:Uncharacterized protein n=1 Tax=Trifolium pratense TaxID=57577 RepID=A0ACB0MAP7_TRIPR|nr:unnamed protein product [Trifolium pratense]